MLHRLEKGVGSPTKRLRCPFGFPQANPKRAATPPIKSRLSIACKPRLSAVGRNSARPQSWTCPTDGASLPGPPDSPSLNAPRKMGAAVPSLRKSDSAPPKKIKIKGGFGFPAKTSKYNTETGRPSPRPKEPMPKLGLDRRSLCRRATKCASSCGAGQVSHHRISSMTAIFTAAVGSESLSLLLCERKDAAKKQKHPNPPKSPTKSARAKPQTVVQTGHKPVIGARRGGVLLDGRPRGEPGHRLLRALVGLAQRVGRGVEDPQTTRDETRQGRRAAEHRSDLWMFMEFVDIAWTSLQEKQGGHVHH